MNNVSTFGVEELGAQDQAAVNGGDGGIGAAIVGGIVGAVVSLLWGDWEDFQQGREAAK